MAVMLAMAVGACGAPPSGTAPASGPGPGAILPPGGGGGQPSAVDLLSAPDPADRQIYPDGNPYRVMAASELAVIGLTVDSQLSNLPKERMIDGNLATQWASGIYQAATAWAAAELAERAEIASVALKTGIMPAGSRFDVQVSDDGATWTTALANQTIDTWNMETRALPAGTHGRFVRIFWTNSTTNKQPRFSIYELQVTGQPAATPSPAPSTAPSTQPSTVPSPQPSTAPSPGPVVRLMPTGATASSSYVTEYAAMTPERAIDGNQQTQWASGEYQGQEATYTLSFDRAYAFDEVRIKTGYLPDGVAYWIETSDDNQTWRTASNRLTSTSWRLESNPLQGSGRYVRVRFTNGYPPMNRFSIFEIELYGRTSVTTVTRQARVDGLANKVAFKGGACIGGWATVIHTEAEAYNDKTRNLKFPAMLGLDQGRYGYKAARVTPENLHAWGGDIGGCGAVAFLDTTDGLADNAGAWTFTIRDPAGDISPEIATVEDGTTAWNTSQAVRVDLGTGVRRWRLTGDYVYTDPGMSYEPPVVVVYKRPDGVWDFSIPVGNAYPDGGPGLIETSGSVYAFYVDWDTTTRRLDALVTFTAAD
jgi:hypothetical protein